MSRSNASRVFVEFCEWTQQHLLKRRRNANESLLHEFDGKFALASQMRAEADDQSTRRIGDAQTLDGVGVGPPALAIVVVVVVVIVIDVVVIIVIVVVELACVDERCLSDAMRTAARGKLRAADFA